jgi:hypothetical protein
MAIVSPHQDAIEEFPTLVVETFVFRSYLWVL